MDQSIRVQRQEAMQPYTLFPSYYLEGCFRVPDTLTFLMDRMQSIHRHTPADPISAYHEATSTLFQAASTARELELSGWSSEHIRTAMRDARDLFSTSVFINRLQTWPRGYPGDFETVEYILNGANRSEPGTWGWYFEASALDTAIAQQHRNKVRLQAEFLRAQIAANPAARVLVLACGSAPDLSLIPSSLAHFEGEIVLNDQDPEALAFSANRLPSSNIKTVEGNAIKISKRIAQSGRTFDVIVAGGLFDYLSSRLAVALLSAITELLAPGGRFFFTNITKKNPFRTFMEYCADWQLIERNASEIVELCESVGIRREQIHISRDATNLALLVSISKTKSQH